MSGRVPSFANFFAKLRVPGDQPLQRTSLHSGHRAGEAAVPSVMDLPLVVDDGVQQSLGAGVPRESLDGEVVPSLPRQYSPAMREIASKRGRGAPKPTAKRPRLPPSVPRWNLPRSCH